MRRVILALAALFAATVFGAPTASAAPQLYGYQIKSWAGGGCVGAYASAGQPVIQGPCDPAGDGSGPRHWHFERRGANGTGTYFRISNSDGMCLVVQGGADGHAAITTPCANGEFIDQWFYDIPWQDPVGIGRHLLVDYNSGMCLFAGNESDAVVQRQCLTANGSFNPLAGSLFDLI